MKKELEIFDRAKNRKRLLIGFYAALVLLVLSEFFIHKHPVFPWEHYFGFSAVYGFASCLLLVFVAKLLRFILLRKEDYYDG